MGVGCTGIALCAYCDVFHWVFNCICWYAWARSSLVNFFPWVQIGPQFSTLDSWQLDWLWPCSCHICELIHLTGPPNCTGLMIPLLSKRSSLFCSAYGTFCLAKSGLCIRINVYFGCSFLSHCNNWHFLWLALNCDINCSVALQCRCAILCGWTLAWVLDHLTTTLCMWLHWWWSNMLLYPLPCPCLYYWGSPPLYRSFCLPTLWIASSELSSVLSSANLCVFLGMLLRPLGWVDCCAFALLQHTLAMCPGSQGFIQRGAHWDFPPPPKVITKFN